MLRPDLFEFRADLGVFEDAGTDAAEDTDPVYQWNDQGPSSRFATQATLASRPVLSSAAVPNYLSFDGTDDRMTFGGSAVLASSVAAWSFEAWVRLTDFASSAYPHILTLKTNTTDAFDFAMSNDANYLGVHIGSASTWSRLKTSTAAASLTGADKHVVATYNGGGASTNSNFKVYIDGVLQTLTNAGLFGAAGNTASSIGALEAGTNPWKGRIYKLAGFSRELTQAQVSWRYAMGVAG